MPGGGRQEAGEHAHGRGFPGAVGTQEADDLAFFYFKRNVVDRDFTGVSLGKPFDFDHKNYSGRARKLFVSANNISCYSAMARAVNPVPGYKAFADRIRERRRVLRTFSMYALQVLFNQDVERPRRGFDPDLVRLNQCFAWLCGTVTRIRDPSNDAVTSGADPDSIRYVKSRPPANATLSSTLPVPASFATSVRSSRNRNVFSCKRSFIRFSLDLHYAPTKDFVTVSTPWSPIQPCNPLFLWASICGIKNLDGQKELSDANRGCESKRSRPAAMPTFCSRR